MVLNHDGRNISIISIISLRMFHEIDEYNTSDIALSHRHVNPFIVYHEASILGKVFRPRSAAEVPRLQDLWLHWLKSLVGSHWHVLSPLAYWCQGDIVRLLRWDVAKSLGY